ncbi:hypothetical protein BGX20_007049, partial [Mortierella sp. AD010]
MSEALDQGLIEERCVSKLSDNEADQSCSTPSTSSRFKSSAGQGVEMSPNARGNKRPRTAIARPSTSSTSTSSISPSVEIEGPWLALMVACVNKLRNHNTNELDGLSFEGLKDLEVVIFKLSRKLLQKPHLTTDETKDLMVAMSGILDLRTWDYNKAPEVVEPTLDVCHNDIDQFNRQLSNDLRLGIQMLALNCNVQIGKISQQRMQGDDVPSSTPMLRLVSHL